MSATHLLEPSRDAQDSTTKVPRRLVVTWQHPVERGIRPVGFLTCDAEGSYRFEYIQNALMVKGFRPLLGFPEFDQLYRANALFPLFAQRVMDARRPDYSRYVSTLGLPEDSKPWEQIARSGGRRSGDTLQLFPVPTIADGHFNCAFLVHGIRHLGEHPIRLAGGETHVSLASVLEALEQMTSNSELGILAEPGNPVNSHALLVTYGGVPIGYVPDLLVDDLARLASDTLNAYVEVVNGSDAPWHLRVLARLEGPTPAEFTFFSSERWRSLAQ